MNNSYTNITQALFVFISRHALTLKLFLKAKKTGKEQLKAKPKIML